LRPEILGSEYCLQQSGLATLKVTLRLEFKNSGDVPLILIRGAPLLGWKLRHVGISPEDDSERTEQYPTRRIIDTSRMDQTKPDPEFFAILRPGEFNTWQEQVGIVLDERPGRASLLGTEQDFTVTVNPWPDGLAQGGALRKSWASLGHLWLEPIVSAPVRIHLEDHPRIGRCTQSAIF
jgi:hypothetical protein